MTQDYTPDGKTRVYKVPDFGLANGPVNFEQYSDQLDNLLDTGFAAKSDTAPVVNAQTGTTYTFATTDLGKTVTFSNASPVAATLSTALSGLATGAILRVVNLGAGVVTLTPSGTTIAGTPLTLATNKGASIIKTGTNAYVMLPFSGGGDRATVSGTTGSPTTGANGSKTYYKFTGSGSVTVATAGLVECLILGSGGGGGANGGGGGSGQALAGDVYLPAGTFPVTIGGGGTGVGSVAVKGGNGNPGALGPISALGGGGGGSQSTNAGASGGSGGGGGEANGAAGAASNGPLGYAGGVAGSGSGSGGGGGIAAAGSAGSVDVGGAGGAGTNSTITGSSVGYGGGGGGGGTSTAGTATHGGGAGVTGSTNGTAGTANTGGGGGGARNFGATGTGGNGGSAVVILLIG